MARDAPTVGRSQTALIAREFAGADGKIARERAAGGDRDILRSRIRALADAEALPLLLPVMAEGADLSAVPSRGLRDAVLDRLGLRYGRGVPSLHHFQAPRPAAFEVGGYDLVLVDPKPDGPVAEAADPRIGLPGWTVSIAFGGIDDAFDLEPTIRGMPDDASEGAPRTGEPYVADVTTRAGRHVRLRLREFRLGPQGRLDADPSFDLAIRTAEWR